MDQPPAVSQEFGSNWYIRGDIGYGRTNEDTVQPTPTMFPSVRQGGFIDSTNTFQPVSGLLFNDAPTGSPFTNDAITRGFSQSSWSPNVDLGVGYRVNDWFRVEATYGASKGPGLTTQGQAQCATKLSPVQNYDSTTQEYVSVGNTLTTNSCTGYLSSTQFNQTALATAYVDLGHWWLFNPFIGAGLGVNVNNISGSLNWFDPVTGTSYAGPPAASAPYTLVVDSGKTDVNGQPIYTKLTDASGKSATGLFNSQSWNRTFNSWKYSFAGQVAAGVGIPISQSATLDLAYHLMSLNLSGGTNNLSQSVTVGVRYNIN